VIPTFAAFAQLCKQTSFTGRVTSKDSYAHKFSPILRFRLDPLKDDWGWVVSIGAEDRNEHWTYPVTFPIRTGERQVIGTGYGSTVQEKMSYSTVVEFVLNHSDFLDYSNMANETLASPRPEAAGELIAKIASVHKGEITVKPLQFGKGDTSETVKWMKFKVSILVPASFHSNVVSWSPASCPSR
jgi:hypothetical protein